VFIYFSDPENSRTSPGPFGYSSESLGMGFEDEVLDLRPPLRSILEVAWARGGAGQNHVFEVLQKEPQM